MYAALFEMTSWCGLEQHIVQGDSAETLLNAFEDIQSLSCLVRMGRSRERGVGLESLNKLEAILTDRDSGLLTIDKLLELDVQISLGTFKCVEIIEADNAMEQLKNKYPNAR